MKIGYLGPEGTFSQLAAKKYASGADVLVQYPSIAELAIAANNNHVDAAVLPIENSLEGGVNTTLDFLAFDCDLIICAEILLKISQSILSNSETVTKIYSHPQPIGQCGRYISQNYGSVSIVFTASTAQAAQLAAKEEVAAIGSDALADIYGLKVVARGIEDVRTIPPGLWLSENAAPARGADKTSIVFSVSDKPGALLKMLSILIFSKLIWLKSNPDRQNRTGAYVFLST